jgi:hypothetical protein
MAGCLWVLIYVDCLCAECRYAECRGAIGDIHKTSHDNLLGGGAFAKKILTQTVMAFVVRHPGLIINNKKFVQRLRIPTKTCMPLASS